LAGIFLISDSDIAAGLVPYKALSYASGSRGIRQSETDAGNGFHPQMSKAGEIGLASFSHFDRIRRIRLHPGRLRLSIRVGHWCICFRYS